MPDARKDLFHQGMDLVRLAYIHACEPQSKTGVVNCQPLDSILADIGQVLADKIKELLIASQVIPFGCEPVCSPLRRKFQAACGNNIVNKENDWLFEAANLPRQAHV